MIVKNSLNRANTGIRLLRPLRARVVFASMIVTLIIGCASDDLLMLKFDEGTDEDADKLLVVNCLLPGQIKKLGAGAVFVTPRRPVKVTALECEQRGGEYTAYDQANSATALKVWLPTAKEGNPEAQTYVGEIYEKGFGLKPDYKMAALWYEKAAKQGFARAKLNLGYLYEKGLGVKQNVTLALTLYRQASGLDDTDINFESVLDANTAAMDVDDIRKLKMKMQSQEEKLRENSNVLTETKELLGAEQEKLLGEAEQIRDEKQKLADARSAHLLKQQTIDEREQELKQKEQQLQMQIAKLETKRIENKQNRLQEQNEQMVASAKSDKNKADKSDFAATTLAPPKVEIAPSPITVAALDSRNIDIAGPDIQLIRPKLTRTRSKSNVIGVREGNKTREIVGRVSAPAGLQALVINNKAEAVDPRGFFRVLFPINKKRNPVTIAAIDKFGKRSELNFAIVQSVEPINTPAASDIETIPANAVSGELGRFHALIIGNDNYTHFPKLGTAVNDAKSVAKVLHDRYGFKTVTLLNANRFAVLASLQRMKKKLTEKDNLLVYYAGHGELSSDKETGYWIPVDAQQNNKRKWIPNDAITDILNAMPVKRILVVADSCYSGSLTRSSIARLEQDAGSKARLTWLRAMAKSKARLALTSGGLQPVSDEGSDNHSVFAKALLSALQDNNGILEGQRLYEMVSGEVNINAQRLNLVQEPEYAPIRHAGHESGEFFFLRHDA